MILPEFLNISRCTQCCVGSIYNLSLSTITIVTEPCFMLHFHVKYKYELVAELGRGQKSPD